MSLENAVRIPTQERARRTRSALVAAAQREFSRGGYAGTTAKSIARAAGVATGSFYQYFKDKDAVLRELALVRFGQVTQGMQGLLGGQTRSPRGSSVVSREEAEARLRLVVRLVVAYHREDPGLHAVLTERRHLDPDLDALTSSAEATFVSEIGDMLRRWRHPGDVEAVAFVLFNMVEGAVHAHVLGDAAVDDARFTRALVDALVAVALPSAPGSASRLH